MIMMMMMMMMMKLDTIFYFKNESFSVQTSVAFMDAINSRCKHKFHVWEFFTREETYVTSLMADATWPSFRRQTDRQTYKRTNRRTASSRKVTALRRGLYNVISLQCVHKKANYFLALRHEIAAKH